MPNKPLLFPMMANVMDKRCVVIGGGRIGWRKAGALLECGAKVVVISPEAVQAIAEAASAGRLTWEKRAFLAEDLRGAALVFAATNDTAVNNKVRDEARRLGVWMNAAYEAEQGDFIVPSALRRGELLMAVTTGGASPTLSRRITSEWDAAYPPEYAEYIDILKQLRQYILMNPSAAEVKQRCLSELLDLNIMESLQSGVAPEKIVLEVTAWMEEQFLT